MQKYLAFIALLLSMSLGLNAQQNNFNQDYSRYQAEIRKYYTSQQKFPQIPITLEAIKMFRSFDKPGNTQLKPSQKEIDGQYGKIKLRIFIPQKVEAVFLNIHGGGLIWGSPMSDDSLNDLMARSCNVAVISPEYRLMPENPIDVPFNDCFNVAKWIISNSKAEFGTDKIFIGGGSAGALLAASSILYIRDSLNAASKIIGVGLHHGLFDLGLTPSHRNATDETWGLNKHLLKELAKQMSGKLPIEEKQNPKFSPLYADLHDLPPAFFLIGKADAFIDDNYFMESRWRIAGNQTYLASFPDAAHGFNSLNVEMARGANELFFTWVKERIKQTK